MPAHRYHQGRKHRMEPQAVSDPQGYTPVPHPPAAPGDAIKLWPQFRARVESDGSLTKSEQAFLMIPEAKTVIGDTIVLAVPDDFSKNYLEQRLEPMLTTHLTAMFGPDIKFGLFVDKAVENTPAPSPVQPAAPVIQQLAPPPAHWTPPPATQIGGEQQVPAAFRSDPPAFAPELPRPSGDGMGLPPPRISEPPPEAPDPIAATLSLSTGRPGARSSAPDDGAKAQQAKLNEKYVFETFVIGSSNRFAHAAAVAVAEAPAKAYNPLFIYGDSEIGRAHV